ncbi:hypothetical protein [Cryptosporangium sp. NPDC048952]|uniref:hypothetical protein n=1 Tax=Cryptosporangium sp. NPDC048952 TaxID=3363961 RepID=UPI00371EB763
MSVHDDIETALASDNWDGAVVEREPRQAKVTHSVRLDAEVSARVAAEATQRGIKPSDVLRELVDAGLAARGTDEPAVVVRPGELRTALETTLTNLLRSAPKVA